MEPIWKGVTLALLRPSTLHLWYGSPSFPLQSQHGCSPVPRHRHRICSISWVENSVFLPSAPSSIPVSRLNAHLGAPSPNTSITAAFHRQTEHLEILLVRSLPSLGGLSRGAQELLGTAPESRRGTATSRLSPGWSWGSRVAAPPPCPAAGLWIHV